MEPLPEPGGGPGPQAVLGLHAHGPDGGVHHDPGAQSAETWNPRRSRSSRDKGLLITITNAEGRVARTLGDRDVLRMADSLNFGPGANWAESCVGTNAIGTALATGRPMQVFRRGALLPQPPRLELHGGTDPRPASATSGAASTSPVPTESDHSRALDIVLSAARALEQRLSKLYCSELEGQMASLFSSMFNSAVTGVLFLDRGGRITSANNAAERLLVGANKTLRGRKADEFFELDTYLAQAKDAVGCDPVPLKYRHGGPLFAQALPTFSAGGDWLDTIVTLTEARPTSPMVSMAPVPNSDRIKGFEHVLYVSSAMRDTIHRAANAARTPSTVLLSGESGTGKELFARGIHQAGPARRLPLCRRELRRLHRGAGPKRAVRLPRGGVHRRCQAGPHRQVPKGGQGRPVPGRNLRNAHFPTGQPAARPWRNGPSCPWAAPPPCRWT